ncbi:phosphoheptose isomerase, partial [Micromonospora sp. NPDC126480]
LCHDTLAIPSPDPQVVQELHLVTSHLLCEYVERALPAAPTAAPAAPAVAAAGGTVAGPEEERSGAPATGPVRAGVEVVVDGGQQLETR